MAGTVIPVFSGSPAFLTVTGEWYAGFAPGRLREHPEGQSAPAGAPLRESTDKKDYIVIFSIFKCSLDKTAQAKQWKTEE